MFDARRAAIRFGDGLSPRSPPLGSPEEVLALLSGPDVAAQRYPIVPFSDHQPALSELQQLRRAYRKARRRDEAAAKTAEKAYQSRMKPFRQARLDDSAVMLARAVGAQDGFRERLVRFWADHFTARGRGGLLRGLEPAYIEEAIRPHVTGRFATMLRAAVTHPLMLRYLDQTRSVGPNAPAARRGLGLNENLARELLELHSIGVGGPYLQRDVRELAELLTGLDAPLGDGLVFRPRRAEPGAETVLGNSYGAGTLDDIYAVLDDLAAHPATATHLARKLAVHFTSDIPDEGLVSRLGRAYMESGGDLMTVYEALLDHPASWRSYGQKVKQPVDFVVSSLRALDLPAASILRLKKGQRRSYLEGPMTAMGQNWLQPGGPDGWPEQVEAWITPHGLAARLQWAMAAPSAFLRALPDPRAFLELAAGPQADGRLRFAAENAESRREGIGLILASPAFQRR